MAEDNRKDHENPRKPGLGAPPRMPRGLFGWLVFLGIALMLFVLLRQQFDDARKITLTEFQRQVKNNNIATIVIRKDSFSGEFKKTQGRAKGQSLKFFCPYKLDSDFVRWVMETCDAEIIPDESPNYLVDILLPLVPWLLIFAFIWFFVFRQLRSAGGGAGMLGSFGRSRHRITSKEHTNVTFDDVAGIDEAKEEVAELIEFLKNPRRFQRLGGRIPRGVLLVGEPGCGKTLLAKAIAGEADVPFFSISGSDFVEMFVGVGASRVRDLFKQAKENAPCIIFLDEIDAVGRRRGAGYNGGGHDEREQTLNAILVEMDGFDSSDQVIVIAATNRADVLDPALTRPGRFDRQVYVPLPDIKGRLEILKIYAKKIKLGPDVDLMRLARGTPMFSGADLAAIINEAAILATMANKEYVEMADLEEARDKVRWGRAKKSRIVDEKDKRVTAYHEAGHALVQALQPEADPIHKVSIIPRGPMGGATFSLPERDRMVYSRSYLLATLRTCFGGRIAEELFCGDVSSGAASDLKQATEIARRMVVEWGMNEKVGLVYYGDDEPKNRWLELTGRDYSDRTAQMIDEEIKSLLDQAYTEAKQLILANRERLETLAQALLKYETLDGEEVNRIIRGQPLDKPTVADLLDRDAADTAAASPAPDKPQPAPERDAKPELGPGPLPQPG